MTNEQSRTSASSRDHSADQRYCLSIEQAAELYAQSGHPRTIRAVQKYCALAKLDCHKVETETGEKYLVAPYSVTRHIAYINEVRSVAFSRDQTRMVATGRALGSQVETTSSSFWNSPEQPRTIASVRDHTDRYVDRLESDNNFLREQMQVKDNQIKELTERARETNILIGGLQKMLSPLLGAPGDRRTDSQSNDLGI